MNESVNENEFRDLLGAELGEEPPAFGGPAEVFAGARRHVVRTRALTGALSVAAVLGIAGGAVALSGGPGAVTPQAGPTHAGAPATSTATGAAAGTTGDKTTTDKTTADGTTGTTLGSGPTSPATTASSEPGPLKFLPAPKPDPGQVLMDGRSAAEILKSLLPTGVTTGDYLIQDSFKPGEYGVEVYGAMSVTDGSGRRTTVGVNVQESTIYGDTSCAKLNLDTIITDCQESPGPNGTRVLVFRQNGIAAAKGPDAPGGYTNVAWLVYPDGTRISISAGNYYSEADAGKNFTPTAPAPVLTPDQLRAAVLDHRWQMTVPAAFAQQARQDIAPIKKDLTQHS